MRYLFRKENDQFSQLIEESARTKFVARTRLPCAYIHARTHVQRRCMPAGVIDISKYAMADRSHSVCWYERLQHCPHRHVRVHRLLYRALHPCNVQENSRKIPFGCRRKMCLAKSTIRLRWISIVYTRARFDTNFRDLLTWRTWQWSMTDRDCERMTKSFYIASTSSRKISEKYSAHLH